jgi:hypothetical protein
VLFSGHMVDTPDRAVPRFPASAVPGRRLELAQIVASVDELDSEAISGGACGGDLMFCELWLATSRPLWLHLPRRPDAFLDESVRFAGDRWVAAFDRVVAHPLTTVVPPTEAMLSATNPHTLNNERMLDQAMRVLPVQAIVLWNGEGGDGPGGTGHLVSRVIEAGGTVTTLRP